VTAVDLRVAPAAAAAAAMGALVAVDPGYGIAAALLAVGLAVMVVRPVWVPGLLVAGAVFAEVRLAEDVPLAAVVAVVALAAAASGLRRARVAWPPVAAGAAFGAWLVADHLWHGGGRPDLWRLAAGAAIGLALAVVAVDQERVAAALTGLVGGALALVGVGAVALLGDAEHVTAAGLARGETGLTAVAATAIPAALALAATAEGRRRTAALASAAVLVAVTALSLQPYALAALAATIALAARPLFRREGGRVRLAAAIGALALLAHTLLPGQVAALYERLDVPGGGAPLDERPGGPAGVLLLVLLLGAAAWAGSRSRAPLAFGVLGALAAYAAAGIVLSNALGAPLWALVGLLAAPALRRPSPAPPAPAYDAPVEERLRDQRERQLDEALAEVSAERERLVRLHEILDARLRRAPALHPAPAPPAPAAAAEDDERLSKVAERERALVERHARLAHRERELAALRAELAALRAELDARADLLAQREQATAAVAAPPAPAPVAPAPVAPGEAPPPAPVTPIPAPPVAAPAPVAALAAPAPAAHAGAFNLQRLERLVEEASASYPEERIEEWRYYIVFLRDHADYDGHLPQTLDYLVADVFDELL
jgi:hypothetical protein